MPSIEPQFEDRLIPAFPGSRAFRFRLGADYVPSSSTEDGTDVETWAPTARLRVAAPVTERLGVQLVTTYGVSSYDFEGSTDFFGTGPSRGNPFDEFHTVGMRLQGALDLNEDGWVFLEGERWSAFAEVGGATRFEGRAFDEGWHGGGAFALGYEIPKRLEIALGFEFGTGPGDRSVGIGPVGKIQWRVTDDLILSNRGRGVQVEYRFSRKATIFASWFRSGNTWRLRNRRGQPRRLTFEDKQQRASAGLQYRLHSQLRMRVEAGAVLDRKLEVDSSNGNLSELDGDPTGFLIVSFEARP